MVAKQIIALGFAYSTGGSLIEEGSAALAFWAGHYGVRCECHVPGMKGGRRRKLSVSRRSRRTRRRICHPGKCHMHALALANIIKRVLLAHLNVCCGASKRLTWITSSRVYFHPMCATCNDVWKCLESARPAHAINNSVLRHTQPPLSPDEGWSAIFLTPNYSQVNLCGAHGKIESDADRFAPDGCRWLLGQRAPAVLFTSLVGFASSSSDMRKAKQIFSRETLAQIWRENIDVYYPTQVIAIY